MEEDLEKALKEDTIEIKEDTKEYSELPLDHEEVYEEVNKDEFLDEKPKSKKKTILIITLVVLSLIILGLCLYFFVFKKDKPAKPADEDKPVVIERPSQDEEYTPIKHSAFGLICQKTQKGDKITKLTKKMVIDCELEYEVSQVVKDVYFELGNSSNLKLKKYEDKTDNKLETDGTTYKLSINKPAAVMSGGIHFYYEVLNEDETTGYVEIKNIVFKDDNDKYYKVLNNLTSFPPEYDDKIYIYKEQYDEEDMEVYYYATKYKYEEETGVLFDTYQCKNESCKPITTYNTHVLINDDSYFIYDASKKTTTKVKVPDKFNAEKMDAEIIINKNFKPCGILYKGEWIDFDDAPVDGRKVAYYSLDTNSFTIDDDENIYGNTAFDGYDVALLVSKGDKVGVFSYEEDDMILDFTNKYKSVGFDYNTNYVILEKYDITNSEYYFEYYNPKTKTFKVNVADLQRFETENLYYTVLNNRLGHMVTMFFNTKGEAVTNMPYVLTNQLLSVKDSKITLRDGNLYTTYDLNGTKLYSAKYEPSRIINVTESYVIIQNDSNFITLNDKDGALLLNIFELKESSKYISSKEDNKVVTVIIKDTSIEEEDKNAYKITIQDNKITKTETVLVE